jgi:DNA-binding NarL/FixJ family response regulator
MQTILLANTLFIVREALTTLLRLRLDKPEIICARNWDELLEEATDLRPDVIILDWELPGGEPRSGLGQLESVHPGGQVIILGMQKEPEMGEAVFVSCFEPPENLVGAVQRLFSKTNLSD